jgi:hypothetical protein
MNLSYKFKVYFVMFFLKKVYFVIIIIKRMLDVKLEPKSISIISITIWDFF